MIKKSIIMSIILLLVYGLYNIEMTNSKKDQKMEENTNPIVFRLAETMPKDHPSAQASQYFANLVNEKSEGKINIKVYYDGKLGNPKEILEQIQFGGIAMARVNGLELVEMVTDLEYFLKPQIYNNADDLMGWIEYNQDNIIDRTQMERITPLVWYYPDLRCFYSDKISFRNVLKFQNKKIQTAPSSIMKNAMKTLGAQAVDSIMADTYKSLSTGYIDGGEATLSEFVLSNHYHYIKHITLSEYILVPDVLIINTGTFAMLDKQDRDLIQECAEETYKYHKEVLKDFQVQWINTLRFEKDLFIENKSFKEEMNHLFSSSSGGE
ncbi:TRAP-type C4-dicarboxylate transport system substrate-binding protein [Natranaerovirga pectinivora]|uniref:TRAP-type C4-dicarboxylate transport system substrate-binding protein n=1 Tax=Natranaerovirga pectinivora TaxID=682400 RepID=A0A4R3MT70_9FIRM|nr:TRAP transporter substrate-binding protein DctP [Natranaerovirga pectinivora]TCT16244.1 TRAP-type C4-dicarboxylate transport system substrate-binding protein [Natranaerovirga pectinivora]